MIGLKATLLCKQVKNIITRNTGKTIFPCIPITLTGYFLPNDQKIFNCYNHEQESIRIASGE